jgi:hypothetical protein
MPRMTSAIFLFEILIMPKTTRDLPTTAAAPHLY